MNGQTPTNCRITVALHGVERLTADAQADLADVLARTANDWLETLGAGIAARAYINANTEVAS